MSRLCKLKNANISWLTIKEYLCQMTRVFLLWGIGSLVLFVWCVLVLRCVFTICHLMRYFLFWIFLGVQYFCYFTFFCFTFNIGNPVLCFTCNRGNPVLFLTVIKGILSSYFQWRYLWMGLIIGALHVWLTRQFHLVTQKLMTNTKHLKIP